MMNFNTLVSGRIRGFSRQNNRIKHGFAREYLWSCKRYGL